MTPADVTRLEQLGYFRYVDAATARAAAAKMRAGHFTSADVHRVYFADAENLAEDGVRDFLGAVAPFLRHAGVPIDVVYGEVRVPRAGQPPVRARATLNAEGWLDPDGPSPRVESMQLALRPSEPMCPVTEDDFGESEVYLLYLGAREYVVFRFEPGEKWDGWRAATASTLALLNELLAAHGSPERAYAYMSDNDQCIVFVTPEMADVLNASAARRERLHDGWGG